MTDTVVSDALKFPQDEGFPNLTESEKNWASAGYLSKLSTATANGKFIDNGLTFTNHDGTNDTVDVSSGTAFLSLDSLSSLQVQSTTGGSSEPNHDTVLDQPGALMAHVPSAQTLSMTASTLNPVWIAYATDGAVTNVSAGDVYLRHGSGESEPPHPSIKIGETNPDDATADFRAGYDNPPDSAGWREDPNSPFQQGIFEGDDTFDLAGRYDVVKIEGECWSDRAQDFGFGLRINGNSAASYNIARDGDYTEGGLTEWKDVVVGYSSAEDTDGTASAYFAVLISGRWNPTAPQPSATTLARGIHDDGGGTDAWDGGYHTGSIDPPLESINFVPTNTTGYDVTVLGKHTSRPTF